MINEELWPPIDEVLIKKLKEVFPERCPSLDMSEREIWRYVGQVEMVRMLEAVYIEQNTAEE
tara:strand:+ start:1773 stop:1958 length:186 start_codon:yes stop_codon:yes gene_type:complete